MNSQLTGSQRTGLQLMGQLDAVVAAWCDWMAHMGWQVAVLACVLTAACWLLRRRSARLRYALWLLVPLRLALPPGLAFVTGWSWWLLPPSQASLPAVEQPAARVVEALWPDTRLAGSGPLTGESQARDGDVGRASSPSGAPEAVSCLSSNEPHVPRPLAGASVESNSRPFGRPGRPSYGQDERTVGASKVQARSAPEVATDAPARIDSAPQADNADAIAFAAGPPTWPGWHLWLLAGWGMVVLFQLARLVIGSVAARKLVTDARPVPESPLQTAVEYWRGELGIRQPVNVRLLPGSPVPMVVGFIRPCILLPEAIERRLEADEVCAVLIHELQHVARHDALLNVMQSVLRALYFFHPAVWWADVQLRRLREDACDEATIATLRGRRRAYGSGLVKMAEMLVAPPRMALAVAESGAQVKRRLERIFDPRLPVGSRLRCSEWLLLMLAAAVLLPAAAQPARSAPQQEVTDQRSEVKGQKSAVGSQRSEVVGQKPAKTTSERMDRPKDDGFWKTADPATLGLSVEALARHQEHAEQSGADAVLVVYKGQIVSEWYSKRYKAPMGTMSSVKSWTGLLVGMLIADGKIKSVDDPVSKYLPEWGEGDKAKVTIRHLLTMSSGLKRRWGKEPGDEGAGSVWDKNPFVRALPLSYKPGERFEYSNEGAQLLSPILDQAAGRPIQDYARDRLFEPLGMADTHLRLDGGNHAWTYADADTTLRDFARVGLLMLQEGRWGDKQIVPADWVRDSTRPCATNKEYGYLWWLLGDPPGFAAMGYLDTNCYVFPSLDLVVARMQRRPGADGAEPDYHRKAMELVKQFVQPAAGAKSAKRTRKHDDSRYAKVAAVESAIKVEGLKSLRVWTGVGDIAIVPAADAQIHVEADVRVDPQRVDVEQAGKRFEDHVLVSQQDGVLTLADMHRAAERNAWSVALRITVPRALPVEAKAGVGDLLVSVAAGAVTLEAGVGDIRLLADAIDSTSVNSGVGAIQLELQEIKKAARVTSGTGKISVGARSIGGGLIAQIGSGDVDLHLGSIQGDLAAAAGAGNLALTLSPDVSGKFHLQAGVGSVSAEGLKGIQIQHHTTGATARGQIGEAKTTYRLKTGVGSITLHTDL